MKLEELDKACLIKMVEYLHSLIEITGQKAFVFPDASRIPCKELEAWQPTNALVTYIYEKGKYDPFIDEAHFVGLHELATAYFKHHGCKIITAEGEDLDTALGKAIA